jgi:xanthine/CO dehydrogenase XdhC/CoxF family maturation factor
VRSNTATPTCNGRFEDLGQEFPEDPEVGVFTGALIPLLTEAMHLPTHPLAEAQYYAAAAALHQQIVAAVEAPARHLGIRQIQDIFREHPDRLYHWVTDLPVGRQVAASRPTTIAASVNCAPRSSPVR